MTLKTLSRSILLSTVALCAIACGSLGRNKENRELAALHLKIGTGYLTQGNYPLAIKELLIAESYDPRNTSILNNLGLAYFVRGEMPLAIEKLHAATKNDPGYTEARNNLARAYIQEHRHKEAVQELEIAVKDLTYTQPEKSWTNLGLAYFMDGRMEPAKSALVKAMELDRNYCPAYTIYGKVLYEQQLYLSAAQSLDQAVGKCRNYQYDEPNYYSALSYLKLGQRDTARAKLQEIITRFPDGEYARKARDLLPTIQ